MEQYFLFPLLSPLELLNIPVLDKKKKKKESKCPTLYKYLPKIIVRNAFCLFPLCGYKSLQKNGSWNQKNHTRGNWVQSPKSFPPLLSLQCVWGVWVSFLLQVFDPLSFDTTGLQLSLKCESCGLIACCLLRVKANNSDSSPKRNKSTRFYIFKWPRTADSKSQL